MRRFNRGSRSSQPRFIGEDSDESEGAENAEENGKVRSRVRTGKNFDRSAA